MAIYLHKTLPLMTADTPEELGIMASKVGARQEEDGAYRLTAAQQMKVVRLGCRTVDQHSFDLLRKRMDEDIEI